MNPSRTPRRTLALGLVTLLAGATTGARWFRCDRIFLGGAKLLSLPSDTAPVAQP
jgi:hypothetical protein